ncbi:asparagine synthase B [Desulfurivibrio alkaliphilus]|uniref:asparagine synthase (glutamine-hydrolyzing) n=1 Tax=Desulfurivibrio alkaliphilus (strain DSM 19089 / UNIQEM U267 / AHT2) TaxID=589865 RepID=D6Z0B3_DESAT|nr:asparagine synthase B [Desulfurivibrio alkaliphilus]ADH87146.1 asparagine synthase (glutamine-hydrolyzing) [Desulfurivibrio alkaliphilus AHT 2]
MCGIAGCIGSADVDTVNRMLDALEHRGPNDRGVHISGNMAFGHTRLSIVDVAGGHQPIISTDNSCGIIGNGEIYNFRKLREQLAEEFEFRTHSDTEVPLHLYRKKGSACVKELDGMFAFCIFTEAGDYLLARDPVGIKPLYYAYRDGNLYFSSELGAMSLAQVEEVHEFPAGHYYTPQEGFVRYYQVPEIRDHLLTGVDEAAARVRDTFKASVKKRLLADPEIPVGAFCSGGLDSSLIAAIAAEEIPNLHTFAVGMRDENGKESDDLTAARLVAEHIDSTHHELIFTEEEYYQALPEVIGKLESYDPSLVRCAVPCYFTCKLAARYVTVVLTGEGADELFAGYHYMKHQETARLNQECRRLISTLHNINLQRADRIGMLFNLELRVPFLDTAMIDLAMQIPAELKIRQVNDARIEKWILRRAFADTGHLPEEVLWRYKVQYTQGAGCESLGERLAEKEISDQELAEIKAAYPQAAINSKEAALYFKIFRRYHPQDSILKSIGIWEGFNFAEERANTQGALDNKRYQDTPAAAPKANDPEGASQ